MAETPQGTGTPRPAVAHGTPRRVAGDLGQDIDLADELTLALAVADVADAYTLPHFVERDFDVDWKTNQTEVTEIDRSAEARIVAALVDARPDHGAFGEEHGQVGDPGSAWQWVIDPIDGTSGFVRGIPVWGTLIALTHRAAGAVLGVVSAPALGQRWWGGAGLGAHVRGPHGERAMRVSAVSDLADAQVSITFSAGWDALGLTDALLDLGRRARRVRGMGDFWQHMLVAEGAVDLAIDAVGVAPYDIAAVQPIVEAAGGTFTDRAGAATHRNDTAISSNGLLHRTALEALRAPDAAGS